MKTFFDEVMRVLEAEVNPGRRMEAKFYLETPCLQLACVPGVRRQFAVIVAAGKPKKTGRKARFLDTQAALSGVTAAAALRAALFACAATQDRVAGLRSRNRS
jgi:hypothetical protein